MCGIAAVVSFAGENRHITEAMAELVRGVEHRGEVGFGFAGTDGNAEIRHRKELGRIKNMSDEMRCFLQREFSSVIGHSRYATSKNAQDPTLLHPLIYPRRHDRQGIAFAFNGNIPDYAEQEKYLALQGIQPSIEGDTEIVGLSIAHNLDVLGHRGVAEAFRPLQGFDGAFNGVVLHENGTVDIVRDPQGFHPVVYTQHGSLVAVASEDAAIHQLWRNANISCLEPGELLRISPVEQTIQTHRLWTAQRAHCMFERIYFGDHRSHIDGISVANTRYEGGRIHGKMDEDRPKGDYVVVVPESAKIAGNGYADFRHIRRYDVIQKDPDIGRTFTSDPQSRKEKAQRKYVIDQEVLGGDGLRGRAMILIDDSLVRGTTMRELVKRLRTAGAGEIHLRLACPPILAPCFYGIDFSTVRELLVRKYYDKVTLENGVLPHDVLDAIAKDLGVDSVKFLPLDAIPHMLQREEHELCMACLTGRYPTPAGQRLYQLAEEKAARQRAAQESESDPAQQTVA